MYRKRFGSKNVNPLKGNLCSNASPTRSPDSPRFNLQNEVLTTKVTAPELPPSRTASPSSVRKGSLLGTFKRSRKESETLWGTPIEDVGREHWEQEISYPLTRNFDRFVARRLSETYRMPQPTFEISEQSVGEHMPCHASTNDKPHPLPARKDSLPLNSTTDAQSTQAQVTRRSPDATQLEIQQPTMFQPPGSVHHVSGVVSPVSARELHLRSFSHSRSQSSTSSKCAPPPIRIPSPRPTQSTIVEQTPVHSENSAQASSTYSQTTRLRVSRPCIASSLRKLSSDSHLAVTHTRHASLKRASTSTVRQTPNTSSTTSALAAEVQEVKHLSLVAPSHITHLSRALPDLPLHSMTQASNVQILLDASSSPSTELQYLNDSHQTNGATEIEVNLLPETFPKSAASTIFRSTDSRTSEETRRDSHESETAGEMSLDDVPFVAPRDAPSVPILPPKDMQYKLHTPPVPKYLEAYKFPNTYRSPTTSDALEVMQAPSAQDQQEPGSNSTASSTRNSVEESILSTSSLTSASTSSAQEYLSKSRRSMSFGQLNAMPPRIRSGSIQSAQSTQSSDSGYASYSTPWSHTRIHGKSSSSSSVETANPVELLKSARPISRCSEKLACIDMHLPAPDTPAFPWTIVPVDQVKSQMSTEELQQLILSSMRELGVKESAFVKEGVEGLTNEIRSRIDQVEALQEKYSHELRQRNSFLKRHLTVMLSFNGEEGSRFADSLITSIRRLDLLAQEVCSTTAHIGKVATAKASHYNAAASLSLAKLNGSYLRSKDKNAKLMEKLLKSNQERDMALEKLKETNKELLEVKSLLKALSTEDDKLLTNISDLPNPTASTTSVGSPSRRRKRSHGNRATGSLLKSHTKAHSTPPEASLRNLEAELEAAMRECDVPGAASPLLKVDSTRSSELQDSPTRSVNSAMRRAQLRPLQLAATSARLRAGSLPTNSLLPKPNPEFSIETISRLNLPASDTRRTPSTAMTASLSDVNAFVDSLTTS